jgi:amidase
LAEIQRLSRTEGIDAVMDTHRLDAIFMLTSAPAHKIDLLNGDPDHGGSSAGPAAMAGYPAITVPVGAVDGLPVGVTFTGRAFSESRLIALAYAFEQVTLARMRPRYTASTL